MQLEHAWDLLNDAKYQKAIEVTREFVDEENQVLRVEANKIIGLAYVKQKDYSAATEHFKRVAEITNDSGDWFNVTTSAALAHQQNLSLKAFEKTLEHYEETSTIGTMSIPNMRLYFMQTLAGVEQYEKAFAQLNELKEIYKSLGLTDETYLYMHGVPELGETLRAAVPLLKQMSSQERNQWLDDFATELDEEGQELINKHKESYL